MAWKKEKVNVDLDPLISNILNSSTDAMSAFGAVLSTIKALATSVSMFISGFANPVLAALQFILDEIISVIRQIRNSGFHTITITGKTGIGKEYKLRDIWPGWDIAENLESGKYLLELEAAQEDYQIAREEVRKEFIKGVKKSLPRLDSLVKIQNEAQERLLKVQRDQDKIRQTRNKAANESIWLISAEDVIKEFLKSMSDSSDVNRPLFDEDNSVMLDENTMLMGGLVIIFGATGNIAEFILKYVSILNLFAKLLNTAEFVDQYNKFNKILESESKVPELKNRVDKTGKAPNWDKKILYSEIMPRFGDVLQKLENVMVGYKRSLKTAEDAFDSVLTFLDEKISQIDEIVQEINEFLAWFEELKQLADPLHSINYHALYIEPQQGGLKELKKQVANSSDPLSPIYSGLQDHEKIIECTLFSIVGTGPSMAMFAKILNFSVDFLSTMGGNPILTDTTKMKEKFGLSDDYFD